MTNPSEQDTVDTPVSHTTVDDGTDTQPLMTVDARQTGSPGTEMPLQSQIEGLTTSLAEIAASMIIMRNSYAQVIANQELIKKLVLGMFISNVFCWVVAIVTIVVMPGRLP